MNMKAVNKNAASFNALQKSCIFFDVEWLIFLKKWTFFMIINAVQFMRTGVSNKFWTWI